MDKMEVDEAGTTNIVGYVDYHGAIYCPDCIGDDKVDYSIYEDDDEAEDNCYKCGIELLIASILDYN